MKLKLIDGMGGEGGEGVILHILAMKMLRKLSRIQSRMCKYTLGQLYGAKLLFDLLLNILIHIYTKSSNH